MYVPNGASILPAWKHRTFFLSSCISERPCRVDIKKVASELNICWLVRRPMGGIDLLLLAGCLVRSGWSVYRHDNSMAWLAYCFDVINRAVIYNRNAGD